MGGGTLGFGALGFGLSGFGTLGFGALGFGLSGFGLSVTLSGAPRPHLHHPHPPLPILVLSDFGIHDGQVSGNAFNSTFILTPDPCLNPSLALTSNPQTLAVLYPRLASLAHVHQRLRLDRH